MRSNFVSPIAVAVLLAVAGSAQAAGSKTTNFNVSASVASNCLVSATNLAFGAYTGVAALTNTSNVVVRCTNGSPYTLKLSTGGGTYATRALSDGAGHSLQYNLYTTSGNSAVWGDGTSSTSTVTGAGTGMASANDITHTVYGTLPDNAANQAQPVGSYNDTITVTIEY